MCKLHIGEETEFLDVVGEGLGEAELEDEAAVEVVDPLLVAARFGREVAGSGQAVAEADVYDVFGGERLPEVVAGSVDRIHGRGSGTAGFLHIHRNPAR